MYLLDTNHLTILQRGGEPSLHLASRLGQVDSAQVFTTIISYHEQTQGWMNEVNRHFNVAKPEKNVQIYQRLQENLEFFSTIPVIEFDLAAAQELRKLRQLNRRIEGMDLRIAAIAITRKATLLTQNLKDFTNIPNLQIEDWSY
jgi:tRNA(fMet)-specific endonuclease VapC